MKIIAHIKPTEEQVFVIKDGQKHATVRTAGKGLALYFFCKLCETNGCNHTDFVKKFLNKA
jgi:hypothetical protein